MSSEIGGGNDTSAGGAPSAPEMWVMITQLRQKVKELQQVNKFQALEIKMLMKERSAKSPGQVQPGAAVSALGRQKEGGGSSKFSGGAAAEAAAAAGPSKEVTPHANAPIPDLQSSKKRSADAAELEQSNTGQKRVASFDGQVPLAKTVQQQNISKGKGRAHQQQGRGLLQFVDHRQVDASSGASPNPHGNKESDAVVASAQNRATPPSITTDGIVEVDGLIFKESGTGIAEPIATNGDTESDAHSSPSPESTVVVSDKIAPLYPKGKGR